MNAVTKANKTDLAVVDFDAYAGAGGEDITAQDRKIPLLKILEALADNLKKANDKFIPDAKAGDIVDTAVNEVVGTDIDFLPVKLVVEFIEWQDKKPVKRHPSRAILSECTFRDTKGQRKGFFLPNGNEVSETFVYYGINLSSGGIWCSVPMARGRLGAGKTMLEKLERIRMPNGRKAPYFYYVWNLAVADASSDGNEYHTWSAKPVKLLQEYEGFEPIFAQAVEFLEILNSGKARADIEADAETGGTSEVM